MRDDAQGWLGVLEWRGARGFLGWVFPGRAGAVGANPVNRWQKETARNKGIILSRQLGEPGAKGLSR